MRLAKKSKVLLFFLCLLSFGVMAKNTLISPMVGGLDICPSALEKKFSSLSEAAAYCQNISETAAVLLENKLSEFGPETSPDGHFSVGYTIGFPLLSYVDVADDGSFSIDKKKVAHRVRLLKETERQAVVYLFSNHFSVSDGAAVEEKIARLDSASLMQLSDGTSPIDGYFSSKTYPWAIDAGDTLIEKVRMAAIKEVMSQLCELNEADNKKIRAVTVLGELHHVYPDFFNGMGFKTDFVTTDYSSGSVARFQDYLKLKYKTVAALNKVFNSDFSSFSTIFPPSKNINKDKLDNFFQHIDYASSGVLTLHGWAARKDGKPVNIKVFVDGVYAGNVEYGLNRMDVYQAKPDLAHAAVGYRYLLDIKSLEQGIHRVDIVYDDNGHQSLLKSLDVPVMGRSQKTPIRLSNGLSLAKEQEQELDYWHDYPESMQPVYYNPLSEEFYAFRKQGVADELKRFAGIAGSSCIGKDRVFSHQIAPFFNSDWSEEKLAVGDSLIKNDDYHLGFNTYGAAFYSDFVFSWLKQQKVERYGMPEVHAMLKDEYLIVDALRKHNEQGAHFISPYYVEIKPAYFGVDKEHEKFKIDKGNREYHSDSFFNAITTVMER